MGRALTCFSLWRHGSRVMEQESVPLYIQGTTVVPLVVGVRFSI